MKRNILLIISLLFFCFLPVRAGQTAVSLLDECAARIKGAKGIEASFTVTVGGKPLNGNLKAAGSRFVISTSAGSSWYNGKSMWSYNPGSEETTILNPTASELAEVNPLTYLNNYKSEFTPAFASNKSKGYTVIILTPKKKKSIIKKIEVAINTDKLPKSLKITSSDGSVSTVTISRLKLGVSIPSSEFEYKKNKYPKAQIVDLR